MSIENRIKYFEPVDYTEGAKLEKLVHKIIDRTASNEILEEVHFDCVAEKVKETKDQSENTQVTYILKDNDLKSFYEAVSAGIASEDADGVREILNS